MRHSRVVLAILAAAALHGAVEPVVATSWEVRRDAAELLDELDKTSDGSPALFERVQALLAEHGDALIARDGSFAPLAEIVPALLSARGLDKPFGESFAALAERRLRDAPAGDEAALRTIAVGYPFTPAAAEAWRRLADRAWDRGRVGAYLAYAGAAHDDADAQRGGRLAAARTLATAPPRGALPASLDGLEEMWKYEPPEKAAHEPTPTPLVPGRRGPARAAGRGFALSEPIGDQLAASDGERLFVFPYLIGPSANPRIQQIGKGGLRRSQCVPAQSDGLAVAVGLDESGVAVTAVDRAGDLAWKRTLPNERRSPTISAPVIIDDLVALATLTYDSDGSELRLIALRLKDGQPAFDALIAKLPATARPWLEDGGAGSPPAVRAHAGAFLVLSNAGVLAKVGADGAVQRIWSYQSITPDVDGDFDGFESRGREGRLESDGAWAVATPSDTDGGVFILGPADSAPKRWDGDGGHGAALDVRDGIALIGGQRLACLDLAKRAVRWTAGDKTRDGGFESARIGDGRALVATRDTVGLYDLGDGKRLAVRGGEPSFAVADGMYVVGGRAVVSAYGRAQEFQARQEAAAAADPHDYRPLVALHGLWLMRGDDERAYGYLVDALARGAPIEYAEKAARLVRGQLQLALDDPQRFPAALGRLEKLAGYDARLGGELALWRGWHHELRKERDAAIAEYRAVLACPPQRVPLANGVLEVQAQALARAALARLHAGDAPPWNDAPAGIAPPPRVGTWSIAGACGDPGVAAGDVVAAYAGGFVTAVRVADGSVAWRRPPDRPMLGVRMRRQVEDGADAGISVDVLPGSAAAACGVHDDDVVVGFCGKPVHTMAKNQAGSLVDLVLGMKAGDAFTLEVQRGGQHLTLDGTMGGELAEAVCANARTVVCWPLMPMSQPDMSIAAFDAATGQRLWRGTLPPVVRTGAPENVEGLKRPPRPLLGDDDLLLTVEGDDLIAVDLRAPGGAHERWRLAGQGDALEDARALGHAILLADAIGGTGRIIDPADGQVLAIAPLDEARAAVLGGGDLVARDLDGRLACWDLGWGRQRWKTERPAARCLAVHGDAVYIITERRQLASLDRASGKQRRLYGDWTAVEEAQVAGDRLYLLARRADLGLSLVAISLDGGAPVWQQALPRGVEIQRMQSGDAGVACVLGDADAGPAALDLDRDGRIRLAAKLVNGESLHPMGDGIVAVGPRGMHSLPAAVVTSPAPVPCAAAPAGDIAAAASAVAGKLAWQTIGTTQYALARAGTALLVFARLPEEGPGLELRLGDVGPAVDGDNQRLVLMRQHAPHLADADAGWRLAATHRIDGAEGTWAMVVRLEPPVDRTPGLPLQVRAASGETTDAADAPWWLRQAWRTVAAPTP